MATLFNPFFASFDGNGVPRAGALLSFFQTGTSTPQNTYTDSTLATPNANPVVADSNGLFPPIYLAGNFDYKAILQTAAAVTVATRDPLGFTPVSQTPPRSYLQGFNFTVAGGTGSFSVTAGSAADGTNASMLTLPSTFTKTTSAWAVGTGAGALDTGVIANSTWYHPFAIQRPDTGAVDLLMSLSATTPTLPANYTLFRHIGVPLKTDGSAHWTAIIHDGDLVQWATGIAADISANNPGTAAVTRTLGGVPTGISVQAILQVTVQNNSNAGASYGYFSDLATTDVAASGTAADTVGAEAATAGFDQNANTRLLVRTNTSAQIRSRLSFSDANVTLIINTLGWTYSRGRNA